MREAHPPWQRILTREAFCSAFAGRVLIGEGMRFVIHADGRITGRADGARLSGSWTWQGAFFCRDVRLDGADPGHDCEMIEQSGRRMRYTRARGSGAATIVSLA